jgi:molecular chaperone GrpE
MSEKKDEDKNKREDKDKEKKEEKEPDLLAECQKQKEEYLAGWQRARADLLNYKKEEIERIGELLKLASQEFSLKLLPVLDNFETAEKVIPKELKEDGNFKGLLMIKAQLQDFLKNQGLEEIKSIGESFDPNFHEVVEEAEIKDKASGLIVEEVQKGYKIGNRLLRPAKVKIVK